MKSEIDLLRQHFTELEAKYVKIKAEKDELETRNAEIPELRKKFAELEAKNVELVDENTKLRQELRSRIKELEKSRTDTDVDNARRDVEIAEIKAEVVKLAEGVVARDNNEENKELISLEEDVNAPCSVADQPNNAEQKCLQPSTPVSCQKTLGDGKTDVIFLDGVHKKMVSDEIRQRNREKKLQRESAHLLINPKPENNESYLCEEKGDQALEGSDKHISFQETPHQLTFLSLERLKQYLGKVEIWLNYFPMQNKVAEICSKTGVAEKTAKSQVYAMIKASLPNVSDSNLYKKTERAGSVYKLFGKIIDPATKKEVMGIGIDKAEENLSLSADVDDYINMLTGSLDDETLYGGTPYENEVKVEKEEVNEVKESSKVQSDDDVYFDEEVDHDSAPHPVGETNDDSDCSHDNDSEEEMPDDSDDDGYNGYNRYGEYDEWGNRDRGYYSYSDGSRERKTSPMMSPIISPVTAC